MELFRDVEFDWLGKRRIFFGLSALLLIAGLASILAKGTLRYGVDFRGGAIVTVRFEERPGIDELRGYVQSGGAPGSEIQESRGAGTGGYDFLIQVDQALVEDDLSRGRELISAALDAGYAGGYEILNSESVGPKAGADLRRQAVLATLYAMGGMLLYIGFRFRSPEAVTGSGVFGRWVDRIVGRRIYGFAAVFAVFHDTLITLGFFSIFDYEINLTVIAALLTLVGYSVNDTIVVFDRIRENLRVTRHETFENVVNKSINQTLSRTVLTSGLTLVAALAMFFFGGDVIHSFAFALVIGVLIGTYSSIAVASPMVLIYENYRARVRAGQAR